MFRASYLHLDQNGFARKTRLIVSTRQKWFLVIHHHCLAPWECGLTGCSPVIVESEDHAEGSDGSSDDAGGVRRDSPNPVRLYVDKSENFASSSPLGPARDCRDAPGYRVGVAVHHHVDQGITVSENKLVNSEYNV